MSLADKNKKYVLVIEDSKEDRDNICNCLKEAGIDHRAAKDGIEALNIAQAEAPFLIIMDLILPGINGFKLAMLFKTDAILREVPLVIFSVMDNPENKKLAKQIGAVDYLTKPFNRNKFMGVVNRYL